MASPTVKKVGVAGGGVAAIALAILMYFTPQHEGRVYVPYLDIGGVLTVCDGITGGIVKGKTYTDAECDALKLERLKVAEAAFDRLVKVETSANRRAALIDFIYNLGEGAFARSTLLKKLNAGDGGGACKAILDWMYVAGKDCRLKASKCGGIVVRREWEHGMCLKPDDPWWKFLGV